MKSAKKVLLSAPIMLFIFSPILVNIFVPEIHENTVHAEDKPVVETTTTPATVMEEKKPSDPMPVLLEGKKKLTTQGTVRTVTMYTSTPEQTDASPCIGPRGVNVCELWKQGYNICASNAFDLGTILHIDTLGDCVVKDRMNQRFPNRIDWYAGYDEECLDGIDTGDTCPQYQRALRFKQDLLVTPLGS